MLATSIALALLAVNFAVFALFGWDKVCAENHARRVPEAELLLFALCGGAIGATLGQQLFRHKTRKEPFRTILFAFLAINVAAFVFLAGGGLELLPNTVVSPH